MKVVSMTFLILYKQHPGDSMTFRFFQPAEIPTTVNVHVDKHRLMAGTTVGIEEHAFEEGFSDLTWPFISYHQEGN